MVPFWHKHEANWQKQNMPLQGHALPTPLFAWVGWPPSACMWCTTHINAEMIVKMGGDGLWQWPSNACVESTRAAPHGTMGALGGH